MKMISVSEKMFLLNVCCAMFFVLMCAINCAKELFLMFFLQTFYIRFITDKGMIMTKQKT